MKAIVTGGAGFIGSHLVDRLVSEGYEVIVVDDLSGGKESNLAQHEDNSKVTLVKKDIRDDLTSEFEGVDVVFHLAALPRVQFSIDNPQLTDEVNAGGTLCLLEHARKAGTKRFIFASSSSIYGDQDTLPLVESMNPNPMSPYALQKLTSEHYLHLYHLIHGMKTVSLRYFNVFGSRMDPQGAYALLIGRVIDFLNKNEQPIIYGDGEQTRDFTYIKDVVEANMLAATTNNEQAFGEMFNIGAGENQSVNYVVSSLIKEMGKDITPRHEKARIEPKHTLADSSKAKELLNWEAKFTFEDAIKETVGK